MHDGPISFWQGEEKWKIHLNLKPFEIYGRAMNLDFAEFLKI
jgi:hypothetical protein